MKWEDYEKLMPKKDEAYLPRMQIDVKCPKCEKKIWRINDVVPGSYPVQYKYECECGWVGYAYV